MRPEKVTVISKTPIAVPSTWNSPSRNVTAPRKHAVYATGGKDDASNRCNDSAHHEGRESVTLHVYARQA